MGKREGASITEGVLPLDQTAITPGRCRKGCLGPTPALCMGTRDAPPRALASLGIKLKTALVLGTDSSVGTIKSLNTSHLNLIVGTHMTSEEMKTSRGYMICPGSGSLTQR